MAYEHWYMFRYSQGKNYGKLSSTDFLSTNFLRKSKRKKLVSFLNSYRNRKVVGPLSFNLFTRNFVLNKWTISRKGKLFLHSHLKQSAKTPRKL